MQFFSTLKSFGPRVQFLLAGIITLIVYWPSLENGFTNWDDPAYITDNILLRSLTAENLSRLLTANIEGNYHPLTMLSFALEYQLFQTAPLGYHITNLLLHLVNVYLVGWLIFQLCRRPMVAFITALFFGIHPMHVESVAWLSERKDLLYTCFYLAALVNYEKHLEKPSVTQYLWVLLFLVLSLLSKAMAASLPLVLLLMDYYKGHRINWKQIIGKWPFFVVSAIAGIGAIVAQKEFNAIQHLEYFSMTDKLLIAAYGLITYMQKLILPLNLSSYYPYPAEGFTTIFYIAPVLIGAIATGIYFTAKKTRVIVFGMLFYLLTILLVLQILGVGRTIIAERYTYIPYIGLFFILAAAYDHFLGKAGKTGKIFLTLGLAGLTGWWCLLTWERIPVWKDSETLWTNVLEQFPNVPVAYNNRGEVYCEAEKYDLAMHDFNRALSLDPNNAKAYGNRGFIYAHQRKYTEAMTDLNNSLDLDDKNPLVWSNRGNLYKELNQHDQAIRDFTKAIRLDALNPVAYNNRGISYSLSNQPKLALKDYNMAIRLDPVYQKAYYNRGTLHQSLRQYKQSVEDLNKVIDMDPTYGPAWYNRSLAWYGLGHFNNALQDIQQAQSLGIPVSPDYLKKIREQLP